MHYYERNIGDYHRKAGRLNILQHGVYNLLIDACYDREQFPTLEEAIDWVWAETDEEIEAVKFVLRKFFKLTDGLYVQNHIAEDLVAYKDFAKKQSENGKKGGRPPKNTSNTTKSGINSETQNNPNETQNNPNEPNESLNHITIEPYNHKPETNLKINNKNDQEQSEGLHKPFHGSEVGMFKDLQKFEPDVTEDGIRNSATFNGVDLMHEMSRRIRVHKQSQASQEINL